MYIHVQTCPCSYYMIISNSLINTESNYLFLSQNIHQLNTHCKYCFHLNCIPQMILCVYCPMTQIKSKVTPACFSFFFLILVIK